MGVSIREYAVSRGGVFLKHTTEKACPSETIRHKIRGYIKERSLIIGLTILILYIIVALAGPILFPESPQDLANALKAPSAHHWFGTDEIGRDVFNRVLLGCRVDLLIAIGGVSLAYIIALPFGLCAGYFGGKIDRVICVVSESILTFPSMVLAIFIVTIFGSSLIGLILTIMVTQAPQLIRYIRGFVMQIRNMEYIEAAKASGSHTLYILFKHVLRNTTGNTAVVLSLLASEAVLVASALGFLGLGVQPPTPELGTMLSRGRMYFNMAPHLMIFPGLFIAILILAFNLLGDGIRDKIDSRKGK